MSQKKSADTIISDAAEVQSSPEFDAPGNLILDDSIESNESGIDPQDKSKQALLDELEKNYWRTTLRAMVKDWRLYVMLVPLVLVFFLWRYMPLYGLLGAFKVNRTAVPVLERDFVGFHFFWDLMFGSQAPDYWPAFRNTFMLSFYSLLFGFPVPIILALFFNEVKNNVVRSTFQILTYLPKFVSTVVVTTLITLLVSGGNEIYGLRPGVVSRLLSDIGAIQSADAMKGLLLLPQYFRPIFILSGIWEAAGYGSIVYFAAIISISPTNYEAARIDGAGKMAQIKNVVLPGMMSTITIMLILRLGELLNVGYEKVLLLYNKNTWVTSDIVSTYVFRIGGLDTSGGTTINQALASSADLLSALLSMVLVVGSNFVSRRLSDTSLY